MSKIYVLIIVMITLFVAKVIINEKEIIAKKENDIAILTLFSYDGKSECKNLINAYGHTFLSLTNHSDEKIEIHGYCVVPEDTVYFSWWAVDKHMGIWFNIEPNYIEMYNRYETRYSISIHLDMTEINKLKIFLDQNDYYSPINNCSKMCLKCWNEVAESKEKIDTTLIITPLYMVKKIKEFSNAKYQEEVVFHKEIGYFENNKFVTFRMENRYV